MEGNQPEKIENRKPKNRKPILEYLHKHTLVFSTKLNNLRYFCFKDKN